MHLIDEIPTLLDCTLRDGSYAINFQFTRRDTETLVAQLDEAGFGFIEVGHGVGLGASRKLKQVAAETDETYMQFAAKAVTQAKWGMFCIPGIADLEDISLAADYGMNFIRIGTNVEDYKSSEKFIEKAKQHRMLVCSNFMKSYASTPEAFASYAKQAAEFGSDLIYIVDSAGGMFPEDVARYVQAVKALAPKLKLGFHGHNNMGLALANSLRAIQLGVQVIDTSLQGLGRSAGNTMTEQMICALVRMGIDINIDPIAVMDISEQYIQPLLEMKGLSSIDLVAGFAQFHSSYMPIIEKIAKQYRVDPRHLIIAVCKVNKADAPEEIVSVEAKKLADIGRNGNWKPLYNHYYGREQELSEWVA